MVLMLRLSCCLFIDVVNGLLCVVICVCRVCCWLFVLCCLLVGVCFDVCVVRCRCVYFVCVCACCCWGCCFSSVLLFVVASRVDVMWLVCSKLSLRVVCCCFLLVGVV